MLKRLLPKSEFSKNIVTLTSGTAIAQLIPLAVTPVLSRIYTPDDFGIFALYLSIAMLLAILATGRYELAIVLPKEKTEALQLLGLSVVLTALLSAVVLCVVSLGMVSPLVFTGNHQLNEWLLLLPLSVLVMGLNQSLTAWSNRTKQYTALSYNKVTQSTSTAGYKLVSGYMAPYPGGLILGNVIGYVLSVLLFVRRFLRSEASELKHINWKGIKHVAKRYIKFPKYDMSSGILNTASVQMPTLLLAAYFTPVVVGWYSLAYTVLKLPMTFVGTAIGQVFFQHSSELKEKEGELARISFRLYKRLLWLGVVPMALVGAFGDVIFEFVLGEEWKTAGMYARILSPWLLIVFAASPITHLLNVLEKQQVNFRFNVFMLVFRAVAIIIGGAFFQDSLLTIVLFGTVSFVLWCWFALRILKMAGIRYMKSIFFTATLFVVVSLLTALLIWLTQLVRL